MGGVGQTGAPKYSLEAPCNITADLFSDRGRVFSII